MTKILMSLITMMISTSAFAARIDFGRCNQFFPKNQPAPVSDASYSKMRMLCHEEFATLYNIESKEPVYSVEKLNYLQFQGKMSAGRSNKFMEDPQLKPSDRSTNDDYKRSGFDKSHNVPFQSHGQVSGDGKYVVGKGGKKKMVSSLGGDETFFLSNMSPVYPEINRVLWAKSVELPTFKYVKNRAKGNVFVFTGNVFGPHPKTIGANHVWVPDYIFKVVYDEQENRSWVYYVPNLPDLKMKPEYLITYPEFVKRTGLNLLNQ